MGDVPGPGNGNSDVTLPPLPAHVAELPDDVISIGRYTFTSLASEIPPSVRAAYATSYIAGGPPLLGIASETRAKLGPEAIADLLLDRERLVSWLRFGRDVARASGFTCYSVTLRDPSGNAGEEIRLLESGGLLAPEHFLAPKKSPEGLVDLRCEVLDGEECAIGSRATARLPRLGLVGIGSTSALARLASAPPGWPRELAKAPLFPLEATQRRDVEITRGRVLPIPVEFAIGSNSLALDGRDALARELSKHGAIAGTAVASAYEGPFSLVLSGPSPASAAAMSTQLQALQVQLMTASIVPATPQSLEEELSRADEDLTRRAIATGKVSVAGSEVRLEGTLRRTESEQGVRRRFTEEREARFAALGGVLEAAAQAQDPSGAEMRTLGGDPLPRAFRERFERAPRTDVQTATLTGLDGVLVPADGKQRETLQSDRTLRWPDASHRHVDDVLDALRAQGFSVHLRQLTGGGLMFEAVKGKRALRVFARRRDGGLEVAFFDRS